MHSDCHLPQREKTPSGRRKKRRRLLFVCGSRRPLFFSWSCPNARKSVVCVVCLLLEEKEGTAGRLSQAYPLIQQDILSPVCCCASYVAGNLVHSVRREASRAAHTALTAPVQSERAAAWRRFGGREGASVRTHTHTGAHMHEQGDPPPDVTATSKTHWPPA